MHHFIHYDLAHSIQRSRLDEAARERAARRVRRRELETAPPPLAPVPLPERAVVISDAELQAWLDGDGRGRFRESA